MAWTVLGFTADAIVMGSQDARLAYACGKAWEAAGRPPGFQILQCSGDSEHMTWWFVSDEAARVLDEAKVEWRGFVIGTREAPAPEAVPLS